MIGRDGRTHPVALPGADRAGGVRGRAVRGRQGRARAGPDTPAQASSTPSKESASKKTAKKKIRVYTVKQGDTASAIAAKTGISIETMQKLNKNFDPQTLAPGQRIRLSE